MPFYTHLMYLWFILPEWLWWLFVVCFCSTPLQSQNCFQSALKSQHYSLLVGTRPSSNSIFDKVQCIVFQRLPDFLLMEIRTLYFLYLQTLWFTAINKFFFPSIWSYNNYFQYLPFAFCASVLVSSGRRAGFWICNAFYSLCSANNIPSFAWCALPPWAVSRLNISNRTSQPEN